MGDLDEESVTNGMSAAVVDGLEVVDVQEQQGRVGPTGRSSHCLRKLSLEAPAIRKACERVVARQELDLLRCALLFGHILEEDNVPALPTSKRSSRETDIEWALATVEQLDLYTSLDLAVQGSRIQRRHALGVLGRDDRGRLAENLCGRVTRCALRSWVPDEHRRLRIGDTNRNRRGLDHRLQ